MRMEEKKINFQLNALGKQADESKTTQHIAKHQDQDKEQTGALVNIFQLNAPFPLPFKDDRVAFEERATNRDIKFDVCVKKSESKLRKGQLMPMRWMELF